MQTQADVRTGNSESKEGGSFEPPPSLVVVLDVYSPGIYSNATNADFSPVVYTDTCW